MSHRAISRTTARRLALSAQRLDARPPLSMLDTVRALGCLQLDPLSVVARSHQLVLWSRLGAYPLAELDRLLWQERALFEYWAHEASIVLTEDYPIHNYRMRHYPNGFSWTPRFVAWLEREHDTLTHVQAHIVDTLREKGAQPSRAFEDKTRGGMSSGWTSGTLVNRMIDLMWQRGELMVAGRTGVQRLWDLAERCLPDWTPRDVLDEREVTRRAALRALHALGIARAADIQRHFTRRRYPGLSDVLHDAVKTQTIERVHLEGDAKGIWYVHSDDLPLLERIERGEWAGRTTLLSPFDNLICDRARTELLFDFEYRVEIYTPKHKRKYGYYVLPALHQDRLIGRVDPAFDRKGGRLVVNGLHREPGITDDTPIRAGVEALAAWLGARNVVYAP